MDFAEAVRSGFHNWNRIGGRASRSEYWWWNLFLFLAFLGVAVLIGALGRSAASVALIAVALSLLVLVPSFTLSVRRLHDTDRSGWWLLVNLIPYIGSIVILVITVLDGSPGPNRYGDRPGGNLPAYRPEAPLIGVADELRKLEELRAAGTISDEEFARQRARLILGA